MLHMVRRFDEKPKDFPKKIRITIIKLMARPDVYHGQGCLISSSIVFICLMLTVLNIDHDRLQKLFRHPSQIAEQCL